MAWISLRSTSGPGRAEARFGVSLAADGRSMPAVIRLWAIPITDVESKETVTCYSAEIGQEGFVRKTGPPPDKDGFYECKRNHFN